MLRRLTLFVLPLALFVSACGGEDDKGSSDDATPATQATATVRVPGSEAGPTAIVINTPDLGDEPIDLRPDDNSTGSDIISAINPLTLLNGLDSGIAIDGVGANFEGKLLTQDDLPFGFVTMGEYSITVPAGEYGDMQMAMSMFTSGDVLNSGELGSMVWSAAVLLPPEALAAMGLQDLDGFAGLSEAELRAAMAGSEALGVTITDLRILDASGLGEGGAGLHMAMDFGQMMSMFGAPADAEVPGGLAFDMYMFFEGDYMYMVMTMYPTGALSGVDARELAEVLDSRTGASA